MRDLTKMWLAAIAWALALGCPPALGAVPEIVGFTPASGSPGTLVKIIGRNLDGLTAVEFDGRDASFRIVSTLHVKALVPAGARTGPIRVESAGGAAISTQPFVVPPAASTSLRLDPPRPNPSPGSVACRFDLPRSTKARLAIHDATGRLVRVLQDGALPAGTHERSWDGADGRGRAAPSGVYVARLEAGDLTLRRSVVLRR
jgi:hypothetical protein